MKIENELFAIYSKKVIKQISLLEKFQLPPSTKWTVNWEEIRDIEKSKKRNRWNDLTIYKELLAKKDKPAIYYFAVDKKESKHLFDLFVKSKYESSKIRREKGVREKGFKSISYVPKEFKMSNCIYVGSRKLKIHERFKQHLGYGSGRTGALHMASVFASQKSIPQIDFYCHILDEKYSKLTEHIECVIQNKLQPFIGKNILGD